MQASSFTPELIDLICDRQIDPGKVFDLTLPLEEAADAYQGHGPASRRQGHPPALTPPAPPRSRR
jgi:hypothetical protein